MVYASGSKKKTKLQKKDMNFQQAYQKNGLDPFGDIDGDEVINMFDCKPYDPDRDGLFGRAVGVVTGGKYGQTKEEYETEKQERHDETEEERRRRRKEKQETWERKQSEKAYETLHPKETRVEKRRVAVERKKKFVEELTKPSKRLTKTAKGAERVAGGFQKRVIEGKTDVVVRGGTIYPKKKKIKPKYYAKDRRTTKRKTKKTYPKKRKTPYEQKPSEMPTYDPFGILGPPEKKKRNGKKPPMFFNPFG